VCLGPLGEDPASPEDDDRAEEDDGCSDPVEAVGLFAVHAPAPEHRPDQEDAGVGGEKPAVAVLGLKRLDDGVAEEGGGPDKPQKRRRVSAKPAPDRISAAEFADDGNEEDRESLEDGDSGSKAVVRRSGCSEARTEPRRASVDLRRELPYAHRAGNMKRSASAAWGGAVTVNTSSSPVRTTSRSRNAQQAFSAAASARSRDSSWSEARKR
jgi:hypothetical protein